MQSNDQARSELLDAAFESLRQARRRERALLRSPVTAPERFPAKLVRRYCKEARDELLSRG